MSNKQFQTQAKTQTESVPETQIQQRPENKKNKSVNLGVYEKYASLKMMELAGGNLKDTTVNEMNSLEKELKKCSGKVSKLTVTAAINHEKIQLIKGIPIPNSYLELMGDHVNYYVE